jgi:ABC-type multidrug transport system ATPase subunit
MLPLHLEVTGLSKVYEKRRGLLSATFTVARGESIAIIGHNGAGKSTLLKILAGWIVPDSGAVNIDGINLDNRSAITRKIGFVPEKPNLFDFFSVEYNLRLFARLFRVPYTRVEQTLQKFSLLEYRRNRIDVLSKGLKQRVNIGRALLADPAILLLDEPSSGLDFEMTRQIYKLLGTIHASGKTILFTSHRPEEIRTLASRIIVIHHAGIVFDGSPSEYFESSVHQNLYA